MRVVKCGDGGGGEVWDGGDGGGGDVEEGWDYNSCRCSRVVMVGRCSRGGDGGQGC